MRATRVTVATTSSVFQLYDFSLWLLTELKIQPTRIEIVELETDDFITGLCLDNSLTDYTLFIRTAVRSTVDCFITLAHEMVHVYQHLYKELSESICAESSIGYSDTWWEREACERAPILVRDYAESLLVTPRFFAIKKEYDLV